MAASVQSAEQPENGLQSVHMALPRWEKESKGHRSRCSFPTQKWPASHKTQCDEFHTVPDLQAVHLSPCVFTYPGRHTHCSAAVDRPGDLAFGSHETHSPFHEYVFGGHGDAVTPVHVNPGGQSRHLPLITISFGPHPALQPGLRHTQSSRDVDRSLLV